MIFPLAVKWCNSVELYWQSVAVTFCYYVHNYCSAVAYNIEMNCLEGSHRQHSLYIWDKATGNLVKMLTGQKGENLLDLTVSYQ